MSARKYDYCGREVCVSAAIGKEKLKQVGTPGYDSMMDAAMDKTKTSLAVDTGYVFKIFPSAVA